MPTTVPTREAAMARFMGYTKPRRSEYVRTIYGDNLESTLGGGATDNKGQGDHTYPSLTELFPAKDTFPQ